jgi:flavin reductase (DIM6/NTAB) family NADH-FMN oxidoreductase RutF
VIQLGEVLDDEGAAASRAVQESVSTAPGRRFTATSVISVSAAPPFLAFASFLSADQDLISARFATSGIDRFADRGWRALPTGEPVIDSATSWPGRVTARTPVGDSYLVSVRTLESDTRADATPLVYHDQTYHRIGAQSAI